MTTHDILAIIREAGLHASHDIDPSALRMTGVNNRQYSSNDFDEFKRDLTEAGIKAQLLITENTISITTLAQLVDQTQQQLMIMMQHQDTFRPILIQKDRKKISAILFESGAARNVDYHAIDPETLVKNEKGEIYFFLIMPYQPVGEPLHQTEGPGKQMSPLRRLIRLLLTEKREIVYILFYGVLIGLLGLILPLGIQVAIELTSGGVIFSSIYLIIGLVILGVLISGGLQIMQLTLVEHLQRRVFAKASLEFSIRIPRIKLEAILKHHAPELMNRFFDVTTIQKGLPKLLIDLSSGIIQVMFGLTLLSLYHPFFILFSLILVTILCVIFLLTGRAGLESSVQESKYKYKVAYWFEEIARSLTSFKLAGITQLPLSRADESVSSYLKYRKIHFNILVTQFSFLLLFKAAVTAGMLIAGTLLVVNREITLGQFVASEVVIILILNAVEKIFLYLDVIYDLLTAVDKVSFVTDIPLERSGGLDFPSNDSKPFSIDITGLKYKENGLQKYLLHGVDLQIKPNEKICLAGTGGSDRSVMTHILAGLYHEFEGGVTVNGYSLRDLDLTHYRNRIGKNFSPDDLFEGTLIDNITVGRPSQSVHQVIKALEEVGIWKEVATWPDGLSTLISSGGKGLSESFLHRLILARCISKKPGLLIVNDYFHDLSKSERKKLAQHLVDPIQTWTLIMVSNDPAFMQSCDRVILMNEGKIVATGRYEDLLNQGAVETYLN